MLLFAASILACRTQLMPAARGETALAELRAEYPESVCVGDQDVQRWRASRPACLGRDTRGSCTHDDDRLVMIGFTSGSTGKSQAHAKQWRALANSARLNSAAIRSALGLAAACAAVGDRHGAGASHVWHRAHRAVATVRRHERARGSAVVSCRCRRRAGATPAPATAGQHAIASACAGGIRTCLSRHRSHRQRHRAAGSRARAAGRGPPACATARNVRVHRDLRVRHAPNIAAGCLETL